jgi:uncharacterized membrane protein YfhO
MFRGALFKPPPSTVIGYRNFSTANLAFIVATCTPLTVTRPLSRRSSKAFGFEKLHRQSIATMATTSSPVDIADLEAQITAETARFNELRLSGGSLDESKKILSELKKALALAKNAGKEKKKAAPAALAETISSAPASKKKERLLLKTAKVCKMSATFSYATNLMYMMHRARGTTAPQRCSAAHTSKTS